MYISTFLEKVRYPKLFLLFATMVLSYFLFRADLFLDLTQWLHISPYVSIFFVGFFFSYGFTSAFAVAFFVSLAPLVNPFLAAPLAGIGAVTADLVIFHFIRSSFQDEFEKLKLSYVFQKLHFLFHEHLGERIKKYILLAFGGFLIASPLPDEFGVTLVSGFTDIDEKMFGFIAYMLNTGGILFILLLAH